MVGRCIIRGYMRCYSVIAQACANRNLTSHDQSLTGLLFDELLSIIEMQQLVCMKKQCNMKLIYLLMRLPAL